MSEYDERLREKLEREYHKKMRNAQMVTDQLEDFKLNYIKKLKEEQLEGELLKKQVEEEMEREREAGRKGRRKEGTGEKEEGRGRREEQRA